MTPDVPNAVSKSRIVSGLRAVGLVAGNTVLVHSSLRSFGYVEGGADTVIDALLDVVGEDGTLVMPTFTWDSFHAQHGVVFDVARTPSETGRITEVFRQREGVLRSIHICHSVAALGAQAQDVMGEGIRPFGRGSSFDQLRRLDSWVLFLGVTLTVCTALHMVEELMQVPCRYYRDFCQSTVVLPDGRQVPSRSVEYLRHEGYRNDFAKVEAVLEEAGVLHDAQVGDARLINVRIRDIFAVIKRRMEADIGFLLARDSA